MVGVALTSCKDGKKKSNEQKSENATQTALANGVYSVDIEKSVLNWKGFKPTGSHNGTLTISKGTVEVKNGKVSGGNFTINMESMKVLDIPVDDEYNAKLLNHLKDADFFDVPKYKTASFKITSVENDVVKGDLTIKEVTKPIQFNAGFDIKGQALSFVSKKVVFDRTEFGIKYKSKKFFDSLKDRFINDEIEVSFDVKATK